MSGSDDSVTRTKLKVSELIALAPDLEIMNCTFLNQLSLDVVTIWRITRFYRPASCHVGAHR